MLGTILTAGSAVVGGISALKGMSDSEKRAKEYAAQLDRQKKDNENWYNARYNRDYTQTAEALNQWRKLNEQGKAQVEGARGVDAMMGTNTTAQAQAAYAKAQGDLAAEQTAAGEAEKRAVESEYLQRKAQIEGQQLADTQRRMQQGAVAGQQGWNAMSNAFGSIADGAMAKTVKKNMFKDE